MNSCLYDTCADIYLSLCVCKDVLWRTSSSSFRGSLSQSKSVLTCLWVDRNLPHA